MKEKNEPAIKTAKSIDIPVLVSHYQKIGFQFLDNTMRLWVF